MKYSEIHPTATSRRIAGVLRRAIGRLPPFHLVGTDNAMVVTMANLPHPERRTAFERTVADLGVRHWRIKPRSPWQNGIIERSNRTESVEGFHQQEFSCSDHRRYGHGLWEMYYNDHRPHQGLDGAIPLAIFRRFYPIHAAAMGALT